MLIFQVSIIKNFDIKIKDHEGLGGRSTADLNRNELSVSH